MARSEKERFLSKVSPESNSGCWLWLGRVDANGYGRFDVLFEGVWMPMLAHRVSFEIFKGPLEHNALHRCDNPPCVNPDHLFDGTQAENVEDMMRKGRHRPTTARGSAVHNAKLNEAKVEEIRRLYSGGGFTQQSLADHFGVSRVAIQQVVQRKTWAT